MSLTAPPTVAAPPDAEEAYATLVLAFGDDPIPRWLLPDSASYLAYFPALLRIMGDGSVTPGIIDLLEDGVGAAIWHPPGRPSDDEQIGELLSEAIPPGRQGDVFALLEQMQQHLPDEPVWYLPFIGVDPPAQGRGHGSRLLVRGLERCDRDGLPAYLEASSPRNRALYGRHGFVVLDEIRVADSPPLWPMLRPAVTT